MLNFETTISPTPELVGLKISIVIDSVYLGKLSLRDLHRPNIQFSYIINIFLFGLPSKRATLVI